MARKQVAEEEEEAEMVLRGSKLAQVAEPYPKGEYQLEVKDTAVLMRIAKRSV